MWVGIQGLGHDPKVRGAGVRLPLCICIGQRSASSVCICTDDKPLILLPLYRADRRSAVGIYIYDGAYTHLWVQPCRMPAHPKPLLLLHNMAEQGTGRRGPTVRLGIDAHEQGVARRIVGRSSSLALIWYGNCIGIVGREQVTLDPPPSSHHLTTIWLIAAHTRARVVFMQHLLQISHTLTLALVCYNITLSNTCTNRATDTSSSRLQRDPYSPTSTPPLLPYPTPSLTKTLDDFSVTSKTTRRTCTNNQFPLYAHTRGPQRICNSNATPVLRARGRFVLSILVHKQTLLPLLLHITLPPNANRPIFAAITTTYGLITCHPIALLPIFSHIFHSKISWQTAIMAIQQ
jgi:hypothetical protein